LIRGHRPDLDLVSATQALAGSVADAAPLRDKRVAVSISASPDQGCNGLTEEHENERLIATQDLTEMIALVLKGLRAKLGS
jgi:hypothetical protein